VEWNRREHVVGQLWQSHTRVRVRRGADNERIDIAGIVNFASLGRVEEDAITAANHSLLA